VIKMNQTMIDYIHAKIDKELEKMPHRYGEQDVEVKLIVTIHEKCTDKAKVEVVRKL
tara:strand:- start:8 stop:178 length:171 start_codon:yes stop_codon:yes gene_type:complete